MQTLIGDFGEELIKELYRITSLKVVDDDGGAPGLSLEEFTGVFCSTMGITMSDDEEEAAVEEEAVEDLNDNFDEALVFDTGGRRASQTMSYDGSRRMSTMSADMQMSEQELGQRGQDDWMVGTSAHPTHRHKPPPLFEGNSRRRRHHNRVKTTRSWSSTSATKRERESKKSRANQTAPLSRLERVR